VGCSLFRAYLNTKPGSNHRSLNLIGVNDTAVTSVQSLIIKLKIR